MFIILGILVFGFVVFPYVIVPLVVRFVHKQSARPQVEQVGPDAFCPELAAYFGRFAACLAPLGFVPAAYVRVTDAAARTEARALLLTNESFRESAAVTEIQGKGPVQSFTRYLEFCTEFVNGDEVNTNNFDTVHVLKHYPEKRVSRLPGVQHPHTLHRAHRRLVERHRPSAGPFVPTRGTEHLHLLHAFEKTYRKQVEFGYLFLDEAAGVYRPTLKGAFLMSWKLAWPVKQAREALAKRGEDVVLRQLGA